MKKRFGEAYFSWGWLITCAVGAVAGWLSSERNDFRILLTFWVTMLLLTAFAQWCKSSNWKHPTLRLINSPRRAVQIKSRKVGFCCRWGVGFYLKENMSELTKIYDEVVHFPMTDSELNQFALANKAEFDRLNKAERSTNWLFIYLIGAASGIVATLLAGLWLF